MISMVGRASAPVGGAQGAPYTSWTKEASEFPWTYDEPETCYFLEGEVTLTCPDGEIASMGRGDLVTFPKGMSCTWKISQDVRKHYRLG